MDGDGVSKTHSTLTTWWRKFVESFQDSEGDTNISQGATFGSTLCWDIQSRWDSGTNHSDDLFRVLVIFFMADGDVRLLIFAYFVYFAV